MSYLSRPESHSLQWIQRYELALNELVLEQLKEVQEALLTKRGSLIDRAYTAYDQLNTFRHQVLLGESSPLSREEVLLIDALVKVRMGRHRRHSEGSF